MTIYTWLAVYMKTACLIFSCDKAVQHYEYTHHCFYRSTINTIITHLHSTCAFIGLLQHTALILKNELFAHMYFMGTAET